MAVEQVDGTVVVVVDQVGETVVAAAVVVERVDGTVVGVPVEAAF